MRRGFKMLLKKMAITSLLLLGSTLSVGVTVAQEANSETVIGFELYEEHSNAGKLSERGYLYEGKPVGEWQRWHENGQISTEAWFTTEGEPAGTWRYYDDAGKTIKEEIYEAGELRETIEY